MKLRCPECGKEKDAKYCWADFDVVPRGTAIIETECPDCAVDFTTELYFDKDGKQLFAI